MEKKTLNLILIGAIIFLIIITTLFILYIKSDAKKCRDNPFIYGASRYEGVSCNCIQEVKDGCSIGFWFNETKFVKTNACFNSNSFS